MKQAWLAVSAALLLLTVVGGCAGAGKGGGGARSPMLQSPDGHVRFELLTGQPRLHYCVRLDNDAVIEPSPMAFIVDGVDLTDGAVRQSSQTYEGDDPYDTRGVHSRATNRYRGEKIVLQHRPSKTRYLLEVRAFDDGVGFRFVLPGKPDQRRVPDERTNFILPSGTTSWSHGLRGHYEGEYAQGDVAAYAAGDWAAPPVTFKLPRDAGFAIVTEAALANYSGMALESDGHRGFVTGLGDRQPPSYPYTLRYSKGDVERLSHPAVITGTITTPWRVILVGRDLNTLVNSDVITNLSPPPDAKLFPQGVHTDWVKPGRAVWRYLDNPASPARQRPATTRATTRTVASTTRSATTRSDGERLVGDIFPTRTAAATRNSQFPAREGSTSPDEVKKFSRLAGQLGFEYQVVEGFWRRWGVDELKDVVDYSHQQGVGLFVWVHSRWLHNPQTRHTLFTKCREYGIAGLKIDFFDHEHKETIDLYESILREAAENHLLLDFHGANKPTGQLRTWPNELTREAIRGMESRMPSRAVHDTTLPFTRYLAGPAEYTPMLFTDRRGDTTWAHQIALPVIFTAPLLTYAAHPQHILENPAVDLIKSIPATWDQTIVLPPSAIGELAAFARRSGDTWFLAVANGTEPRKFTLQLSFLGDGPWRATIVRDDPANGAAVRIERDKTFDRQGAVAIDMPAGGGFVARFTKAQAPSTAPTGVSR
jgi:alpha-glucosidase